MVKGFVLSGAGKEKWETGNECHACFWRLCCCCWWLLWLFIAPDICKSSSSDDELVFLERKMEELFRVMTEKFVLDGCDMWQVQRGIGRD